MYTLGSTDKVMVTRIQQVLKVPVTGVFDYPTFNAVKLFQSQNSLIVDGIVGRETLHTMGILDTDLRSQLCFTTPKGLIIQKHWLPKGEFIQEKMPILNDYLFLHHTAGWNDPMATIDGWARDERGTVGTEFVIGGQRITNGNEDFDGMVVQSFPEGCQGWHVASDYSYFMNRHSVGIELCNFGQLTDDGKAYTGVKALDSQITLLSEPYKGYTKFHKYSDKQLYALKQLIEYVAVRDNIDVRKGIVEWINTEGPTKAFDFHQDAADGKVKGLLIHANAVKTKLDVYPQKEMVDMLLSL